MSDVRSPRIKRPWFSLPLRRKKPRAPESAATTLTSTTCPDEANHEREDVVHSEPLKKKFQVPPPRLPFCEEYDGINMRKTRTISQSIVELMAAQKERRLTQEKQSNDGLRSGSTTTVESDDDGTDETTFNRWSMSDYSMEPATTDNDDFEPDFVSLECRPDPFENVHVCRIEKEEICTIDLELKFLSNSNLLALCVLKAEDVTDARSPNKLIDTFVKVSMFHSKHSKKQKTDVVYKSRDPVFMHIFFLENVIEKYMHLMCLRIQLYEKKRFWTRCIGETLIWLDDLELMSDKTVCVTESLQKPYL